jgi:hypothetical protein
MINVMGVLLGIAALMLCYEWARGKLMSRGFLPVFEKKEKAQTAAYIRNTLGACVICSGSMVKHRWHELISVVEPSDSSVKQIEKDVADRNWLSFVGKYRWDPQLDALVFWLVECCARGGGALYRVESRAGFDQDDKIQIVQLLDEGSTRKILSFLGREEPLIL